MASCGIYILVVLVYVTQWGEIRGCGIVKVEVGKYKGVWVGKS